MTFVKQDLRERLERYRRIDPVTGCWIWTGSHFIHGYGNIRVDGVTRGVHRVAFEVYVGSLDPALIVKHSCDVKDCFNPEHLNQGTRSENALEAYERGRITDEHKRKCLESHVAYYLARTACVHGHPYTSESTYVNKRGHRQCKICGKLKYLQTRRVKNPRVFS